MHPTQHTFVDTFDPDVDAAMTTVAQADTVDDALAMMQTPPAGGSVAKQIIKDMAQDPARTMANMALQRRDQVGEEGIAIVFPVLEACGFHRDDLIPHLPQAQKFYAERILASQKVLDDLRAAQKTAAA